MALCHLGVVIKGTRCKQRHQGKQREEKAVAELLFCEVLERRDDFIDDGDSLLVEVPKHHL